MLAAAITIIFPLCLAYAAFTDMFTMTIPNRVSVILLLSFTVIAPATGMAWTVFAEHYFAAFLVLAVCFTLFAVGVMGAGDAKLLTTASLWFGLNAHLFDFLVLVAFVGGVLTLAVLVARQDRFAVLVNRVSLISHLTDPKLGVPYGIAIGIAGLLSFPASPLAQFAMGG